MNYLKSYSLSARWSYEPDSLEEFVLRNDAGEKFHSIPVDPTVPYRDEKSPFRDFSFSKTGGIVPATDEPIEDTCLCFFYIRGSAHFHGNADAKIVSIVKVPKPGEESRIVKKIGESYTVRGCDVGVVVTLKTYGTFFIFENGNGSSLNCTFKDGMLSINGEC